MTLKLLYAGEAVAELTDIVKISPSFDEVVSQTAASVETLTQGLISFSCTIEDTNASFEELKAQLDRLSKPQKSKITERQIQKTMRMRGIR